MRIPTPLAWLLLLLTFFTAGLLRQFHDQTPRSPFVDPVVGSLLFLACFFLLLVSAWEWRRGAIPGPGVRLGSITPIMLILLVEKWISLALYEPLFAWLVRLQDPLPLIDAKFRAFAGVSLLLVCFLVARFSIPAARKTWRRARPSRWPVAAAQTALIVVATYALLGGTAMLLGGTFSLHWPNAGPLLGWTLGGQAVLALAEEVYYRGLVMSEMERLAPRLGARSPMARRWIALLSSSVLFSMEHLSLTAPDGQLVREAIFTVSLGLLLGLLIMASANLHLGAGVHAWINWLLLGAVPYYVDETGQAALPAGTYIGLTLILAFVLVYLYQRWRRPGLVRRRSA